MSLKLKKEQLYFLLAVTAALIALALYILFGRPDLEQGRRELENSDPSIESVKFDNQVEGQTTVTVNCDDGRSYQIYYPPGETDFEALRASKCSNFEAK
jgi:hypothetical protein